MRARGQRGNRRNRRRPRGAQSGATRMMSEHANGGEKWLKSPSRGCCCCCLLLSFWSSSSSSSVCCVLSGSERPPRYSGPACAAGAPSATRCARACSFRAGKISSLHNTHTHHCHSRDPKFHHINESPSTRTARWLPAAWWCRRRLYLATVGIMGRRNWPAVISAAAPSCVTRRRVARDWRPAAAPARRSQPGQPSMQSPLLAALSFCVWKIILHTVGPAGAQWKWQQWFERNFTCVFACEIIDEPHYARSCLLD